MVLLVLHTDHDWCSLVGKCSKPTMSLLCGVAAACDRKRSTAVKVSTVQCVMLRYHKLLTGRITMLRFIRVMINL